MHCTLYPQVLYTPGEGGLAPTTTIIGAVVAVVVLLLITAVVIVLYLRRGSDGWSEKQQVRGEYP